MPRTAALPVEHETFGPGSAFAASITSNERPVLHVRFADGEHMLLADQSYWKTANIMEVYGKLVAREVESERKAEARNERKRRGTRLRSEPPQENTPDAEPEDPNEEDGEEK